MLVERQRKREGKKSTKMTNKFDLHNKSQTQSTIPLNGSFLMVSC